MMVHLTHDARREFGRNSPRTRLTDACIRIAILAGLFALCAFLAVGPTIYLAFRHAG